jgi:hypothetical protein
MRMHSGYADTCSSLVISALGFPLRQIRAQGHQQRVDNYGRMGPPLRLTSCNGDGSMLRDALHSHCILVSV